MALLACGWVNPGDNFKRPDDAAWWQRKYGRPLWEPLETYADFLDRASVGSDLNFDQAAARGDSSKLSSLIAMTSDDLAEIRKVGADVCAPFLIPGRVGVLPLDNLVCQTRLNLKPVVDETDRRAREVFGSLSVPWWVWMGLAFVLTKRARR
jgi:hypothetical protein